MTLLKCHRPAIALKTLLMTMLVVLSLFAGAETRADALAQVNRTTVAEGSTLTLRVRTRDLEHSLDITPLLRDFEVVSQTQSTNNPALTGLGTEFQEWELVLTPRSTGQLTIPPLLVGEQLTQPISIRVIAVSPEQRAVMDREVFLEVDISNESPYVGEAVLVRLSLYYNVNVNGTFADVNPEQSEWEALGDGHTGTTERGGNTFNYTRFHYIYTPLTEGERSLPAFEFEGDYRTHNLAPRQTLTNVRSDPIALEVKPVPEEFPAGHPWLPARDLTLSQSWSDDQDEWSAGDQLSRSLTLTARGPAAANLPSVLNNLAQPEGVNTYAGSARTEDDLRTEDRVATRREQQEILFIEAGEQVLPEIRVPWWDLDSDQLRWSELPGRTVQVEGVMPSSALPEPETGTTTADATADEPGLLAGSPGLRWLLAGLLGAAMAFAGLLLWRRYRRTRSSQRRATGTSKPAPTTTAPSANWKQALRRRLSGWGHWVWFLITVPLRLLWRLIAWVARPLTRRLQPLLNRTGLRWPHWFSVRQLGDLWYAWRTERRRARSQDSGASAPGHSRAEADHPLPRAEGTTAYSHTPAFLAEAQAMANEYKWAGLMSLLARQLVDHGWPDTQKLEHNLGLSGLAELIRRTQRQQYGREQDREADQTLEQDWQAMLASWPDASASDSRKKHAPGLYPD